MNWKSFTFGVVAALVLFVAVTGSVWFVKSRPTVRGGHQAVFLTNGQVYFGKIESKSASEIKLTGIYYLQSDKASTESQSGDVKLNKLGNELHGPEDVMYINMTNVLFVEDLKSDSKVVQAMK